MFSFNKLIGGMLNETSRSQTLKRPIFNVNLSAKLTAPGHLRFAKETRDENGRVGKPNLRKGYDTTGNKQMIVVACILVAVYMYPSIFKPLFRGESQGESSSQSRS